MLGPLPVGTIDTPLVLRALKSVWENAPETGSRLRGRIEAVLDWATAAKYRHGDNPARWSGLLEHLLPAPRKAKPVVHHAAMAFAELPAFVAKLRGVNSVGARALEFLILTAARTGEVFGARWDEIDGDLWTIPGTRMKGGRPHEVPLSARCLEILTEIKAHSRGDAVFPGRTGHNPLAAVTFRWLLAKLGHADVTVHGFRASSGTGAASAPASRVRSPKPPSRIRSATRSSVPTAVAVHCSSAGCSWRLGRNTARRRQFWPPMWSRSGRAREQAPDANAAAATARGPG